MVNVVEQTPNSLNSNAITQEGLSVLERVPWDLVINITIISVVIILFLGIIFFILYKIYKKIKDIRKRKEDLEYYKFFMDLKMCNLNSDKRYRYKNPWSIWLFFKRASIYAITEHGRKFVGYYDGEAVKKEGFFILGLLQKHSMFNSETDVVIIPYNLSKHMVKRNDDFSIDIECEGIDEVMSSEYYSIPVIKNDGADKKKVFADFSNMITKDFFKEYVYRDVIKTNIKDYADGIKEATEMNPNIQFARKDNSNLKN